MIETRDSGIAAAQVVGSSTMGGDDVPGRITVKVVPRWVASPYFVGYRISQVDCDETLEAAAEEMRRVLA